MLIKFQYHKVVTSSSDHRDIIPRDTEYISNVHFYSREGKPSEHFSYCLFQANIGVLPISKYYREKCSISEEKYLNEERVDWETFALITNATNPYLRCTYHTNGSEYPCGGSEYVSCDNAYSLMSIKERNSSYPILAYGIGAIFVWDLDYDNECEDFRQICSDEELRSKYYHDRLHVYLKFHSTLKYKELSLSNKEYYFIQEHLSQEKKLWAQSAGLKKYSLLYQYTEKFVHSYFAFLEDKLLKRQGIDDSVSCHKKKIVYVSYPWYDSSVMDVICKAFETKGILYKRDKNDCGYRSNISNFEREIANADIIVALINKRSLYSLDCMYEMCKMVENGHFEHRLYPIVMLPKGMERNIESGDKLMEYWKKQLEDRKKKIPTTSNFPLILEELEFCNTIVVELPKFWKYICRYNELNMDSLLNNDCEILINAILAK